MNRKKNATLRADMVETAEGAYQQALIDAGNEYRENLALGMDRDQAETIWRERTKDAEYIRNEELDHIDVEFPA